MAIVSYEELSKFGKVDYVFGGLYVRLETEDNIAFFWNEDNGLKFFFSYNKHDLSCHPRESLKSLLNQL